MSTTTQTITDLVQAVRENWTLCPILADAVEEAFGEAACGLDELRAKSVYERDPDRTAVGRGLISLLGIEVVVDRSRDRRTGRLRARTVAADELIADVAGRAFVGKLGRAWAIRDGGTVANSYGYPASTEGALAAAVLDGATIRVALFAGELSANKVTHAGVAGLFGFRDLADSRVSEARRDLAREQLYALVMGGA